MCGDRTRRFSGKAGRHMATELRPERPRSTLRMLRAEDDGAVGEILGQSHEAVFWPEASVKEVLEWNAILGIATETVGQVHGSRIGRHTGDEAEVFNLRMV